MRYLILSDIHANIDALDCVLAAAPAGTWDRVLVLGDLVGYGAEPNGVVDRIRALEPLAVIRGNHDKAACGIEDGSSFNNIARLAAQWTLKRSATAIASTLRALPAGPMTIDDVVEICHGAPFDEDHYIFDADDAGRALDAAPAPCCCSAHASAGRLPAGLDDVRRLRARRRRDDRAAHRGGPLPDQRGIGRPAARQRPAGGVRDLRFGGIRVRLRRVPYPVAAAQRRILNAGLPSSLANRLAVGR